jgi:copper chaperone CopZ
MKKATYELPTLYGDHHVIEVRRILLGMPGVQEVYASSGFHFAEVTYDPAMVNDLEIAMKLDEAGYLGEWSMPMESGESNYLKEGEIPFSRHTEVYETTRQVVSFAQKIGYSGRPLWTCPGMGIVRKMEE